MKTGTKKYQVESKIQSLEVGQSFNKKEFIIYVWNKNDYFVQRSFDVMFNTAKKELSDREFVTEKGFIIRTK
jgi:hypothetical protein